MDARSKAPAFPMLGLEQSLEQEPRPIEIVTGNCTIRKVAIFALKIIIIILLLFLVLRDPALRGDNGQRPVLETRGQSGDPRGLPYHSWSLIQQAVLPCTSGLQQQRSLWHCSRRLPQGMKVQLFKLLSRFKEK